MTNDMKIVGIRQLILDGCNRAVAGYFSVEEAGGWGSKRRGGASNFGGKISFLVFDYPPSNVILGTVKLK